MGRHWQCGDQHCKHRHKFGYSHWSVHVGFPSPCPYVSMKLVFSAQPTFGRDEIFLFTASFEHSVGFRSDINANLMQDVCFLTRDGKLPFILGADFNFPPNLWQDLSMHGGSLWLQRLGASVVIPEMNHTHVPSTGKGQKPDIIDNFLVSLLIQTSATEVRDCEVSSFGSHVVE